ncbi:MAG: putative glycoside hydrolase [Lachnospiraceae bacterium]|nr:putative glycoside hydrolase [Lachnospiraceae bacterium]
MAASRYGNRANTRYRSGTKRAIRRKQLLCTLVALAVCAVLGYTFYRKTVGKNVSEYAAKQGGVNPTEVPNQSVSSSDVAPHGLYLERYAEGLSEDDMWMEDFEDNRERQVVKGIYISAEVLNLRMKYLLDLMDTTELNAIIVDIKNDDGFITVKTESQLLNSMTNTYPMIDNIADKLRILKEHNVYLIARVVCFRDIRSVRSNESYGVHMKDGTLMKDSNGYTWMNPFNQNVWEYLTEVGRVCAGLGFDEVNFDYCRFSTDSKVKEADFGAEMTTENKEGAITGFVKYACENLKPLGVFVSVDVFGVVLSSTVDAAAVGQNYADMSSYLDYICPMVYPSHYSRGYYNIPIPDADPYGLIYNAMLDSKKVLAVNVAKGRCAQVRPWLQSFTATWVKGHITYGGEQIRAQIDATYDAGYEAGWELWNALGNYSKDGLNPE